MPIRELSRRVGVSTDLLRKWERRYGVLKPARTVGNQRLYSRLDEARARVMLGHVRQGVPAAQAAELAIGTRFRIQSKPDGPEPAADNWERARREMARALERYDETAAEHALEKLLATTTVTQTIGRAFLPYLREVGERWAAGHLNVAQEHFASGFIHGRMMTFARGWDRGLGPRALLACPGGEQHTLGLLAFGIALHEVGWRITYLGADTPATMLAQAAAAVRPALTVISVTDRGRLDGVHPELGRLAIRFPLAVAGAGCNADTASVFGARYLAHDPITAAASLAADPPEQRAAKRP
jgi:MerR family transcriptional regulator, light-induced transcriptional regulator